MTSHSDSNEKTTVKLEFYQSSALGRIEYIKENGLDWNFEDNTGGTWLHKFTKTKIPREGYLPDLLDSYPVNINHQNYAGETAIFNAAKRLNINDFKILISRGAFPLLRNYKDVTVLHLLARRVDDPAVIIAFIKEIEDYVLAQSDPKMVTKYYEFLLAKDHLDPTFMHCFINHPEYFQEIIKLPLVAAALRAQPHGVFSFYSTMVHRNPQWRELLLLLIKQGLAVNIPEENCNCEVHEFVKNSKIKFSE